MHRFRRVLPLLLLLLGVWQIGQPVQAQDNLLKNPNFENPYGGIGTADGWDGGSVKSPHTESWMNLDALFTAHRGDKTYEGQISQQMGRGDSTFTAAVWQKVDNIAAGTKLRFTAWVYVESEAGSNARARIGIDSNNIASPLDDMTWSAPLTNYNTWQQLSVEATVPAGYVTVYIFGQQDWPKRLNQIYMDQASLTIVGTGQPVGPASPATAVPGSTAAPVVVVPTTPPQVYAPSVSAQDKDATDGITHTVQTGDTLAAIAVAYGTTVTSITELNGIDRRAVLTLGQKLIIKKPEAASSDGGSTAPDTTAAQPTTDTSVVVEPNGVAAQPTNTPGLAQILGKPTEAAPVTTEDAAPAPTEEAAAPTQAPATDVPPSTSTTAPTQPPATDVPQATATVAGTSVAEAVTSLEAGVCVTLFDDANQNRFQESTEAVLAGGMIALRDAQGKQVAEHLTTTTQPFCFTDIAPATYTLGIVPPDGYGLTTTSELTVNVQVGAQFQLNAGAAKGVQPLATPTPDTSTIQTLPDADVAAPSSGVLVLIFVGLIAVVAIGAGVLIFVIRRL